MKRWMALVSVVMALVVGFVLSAPVAQAAEEAKKEGAQAQAGEKKEEKKEGAQAGEKKEGAQAPAAEKKEGAASEAKLFSVKGKVETGGEAILLKTGDGKEFKLEGSGLKDYVGKNVQVSGELDEASKTIKVKEIKPAE